MILPRELGCANESMAATSANRVSAVEIAPKFVEHLTKEAAARNLPQVEAILATDRDVRLPKHSIQTAFLCDPYHHFEYPPKP